MSLRYTVVSTTWKSQVNIAQTDDIFMSRTVIEVAYYTPRLSVSPTFKLTSLLILNSAYILLLGLLEFRTTPLHNPKSNLNPNHTLDPNPYPDANPNRNRKQCLCDVAVWCETLGGSICFPAAQIFPVTIKGNCWLFHHIWFYCYLLILTLYPFLSLILT